MKSKDLPLAPRPKHESELSQMIKSFTATRREGDRVSARRLIDRAWRLAPQNAEINFLYGRLEFTEGVFDRAIELLQTAATLRIYPDYEAAYISALCAGGKIELSHRRLEAALAQFAVTPDSALAQAARRVTMAAAANYPGWIGIGSDLKLYGEIVGKTGVVKLEIAGDSFSLISHRVICDGRRDYTPFEVATQKVVVSGHLTARLRDKLLLGGKLDFPPHFGFDGRLMLSKGVISGWATLRWDPSRSLELAVSSENGFSMALASTPDSTQVDRQLFSFELGSHDETGNAITVNAVMPDGSSTALPASPFLVRPTQAPTLRRLRAPRQAGPRIVTAENCIRRAIDIVIPVYSGIEETLTCIRSVIATVKSDAEIVVVDDASPEAEIRAALDSLAADGTITLLRNPTNLGFPGAVNRGLALHSDRDAVILNADTEVYGDWLARLRIIAASDSRIATITPLTNSGSIATYPSSEDPNLPSDVSAAYDRLAASINGGTTVEIPTGVGFCLYMRRDCMNQIGYFDAQLFAKGYGEENDFCIRAAKAGWKHVLATNIYVRHAGSRSFGGRRAALYERNLRLLNLRHRGYDDNIRDYLRSDPAHLARRRLDEACVTALGGTYVLVVSLALDGGVSRAVQERRAAIRESGLRTILLTPNPQKSGSCTMAVDQAGFDDLYYDFTKEAIAFVAFLGTLKFDRVELHHFLDLPPDLVEQLFRLPCPVDIKIHDYVWYCPQITLLDGSGRYCGEPDVTVCQSCVERNGSRLKETISVKALRKRSARWLKAARDISVPSQSVATRMAAQFPGQTFRIEPLEADIPAPVPIVPGAANRMKIALIGAIGDHKGYEILLGMAKYTAKHDLPLDFVVIGFTKNDRPLIKTGRVFVTGRYEEAEVPSLIARENPNLILFLSVFPESWCYALTHALRARIPVASFDLGATADRLRDFSAALLFPPSAAPAEICNRLLGALKPLPQGNGSSLLPAKPDSLMDSVTPLNLRTNMAPISSEPTASVNLLPLTTGLFLFSVRSKQPGQRVDDQGGIVLPAIQVTVAPGGSAGQVEFMAAPQTEIGWLREPNDLIVAKVSGPSALVMLTSVMIPGMTPLEIEIQRLGQLEQPAASAAPVPPTLAQMPTRKSVRLEITPHVQNHGDIPFGEAQWAGLLGQGLWIESFAVSPLEEISPDAIEYMAVTATGVETPWISNGGPCGTRGIGVPLTGFAVRAKLQAGSTPPICEYGAILLTGTMVGPFSDGAMCKSANSTDPIAGIWVSISTQDAPAAEPIAAKRRPAVEKSKIMQSKPAPPAPVAEAATKRKKAPIGPRFSVFRESSKPEQE